MSAGDTNEVRRGIFDHIDAIWLRHPKKLFPVAVPHLELDAAFRIVRISPSPENPLEPWVYLSLGSWEHTRSRGSGIELMLLAPSPLERHRETLTRVIEAHHGRPGGLAPGDVVALGRGWLPDGSCDHLLVTLPYPYGPILERCDARGFPIRILWLLPITPREAQFTERQGFDALEQKLESRAIDFMQVDRGSVV